MLCYFLVKVFQYTYVCCMLVGIYDCLNIASVHFLLLLFGDVRTFRGVHYEYLDFHINIIICNFYFQFFGSHYTLFCIFLLQLTYISFYDYYYFFFVLVYVVGVVFTCMHICCCYLFYYFHKIQFINASLSPSADVFVSCASTSSSGVFISGSNAEWPLHCSLVGCR